MSSTRYATTTSSMCSGRRYGMSATRLSQTDPVHHAVNAVVWPGIRNERRLKSATSSISTSAVIKDGYHAIPAACTSSASRRCSDSAWPRSEGCHVACHRAGAPGLPTWGHRPRQSRAWRSRGFSGARILRARHRSRGTHEDPQILHYGEPDSGLEIRAAWCSRSNRYQPASVTARAGLTLTVVTKDHSLSAAVGTHGAGDAHRARVLT